LKLIEYASQGGNLFTLTIHASGKSSANYRRLSKPRQQKSRPKAAFCREFQKICDQRE
jgi:hypothetical protein